MGVGEHMACWQGVAKGTQAGVWGRAAALPCAHASLAFLSVSSSASPEVAGAGQLRALPHSPTISGPITPFPGLFHTDPIPLGHLGIILRQVGPIKPQILLGSATEQVRSQPSPKRP